MPRSRARCERVLFDWQLGGDRLLVSNQEPRLGSHLVTPRRGYLYHGIDVRACEIVHYSGLAHGLRRGAVEEVPFAPFARGRCVWIKSDAFRTPKFMGPISHSSSFRDLTRSVARRMEDMFDERVLPPFSGYSPAPTKPTRGSIGAISDFDMAETPLELGLRAGGSSFHDSRTDDGYCLLEAHRQRLRMDTCADERLAISTITLGRSHDWVHHVITLWMRPCSSSTARKQQPTGRYSKPPHCYDSRLNRQVRKRFPTSGGACWPGKCVRCETILIVISQGRYWSAISARSFSAANHTSPATLSAASASHRTLSSCYVAWNWRRNTC